MPQSPVFNATCYLARYPDLKANLKGDLPGTVYSTEFNENAYKARYPDVKQFWKGAAIDHYNTYGSKEGRVPGYEIIQGSIPDGAVVSPGTVIIQQTAITTGLPSPIPIDTGGGIASTVNNNTTSAGSTQSTLGGNTAGSTPAASGATTAPAKKSNMLDVWIGLGVLGLIAVVAVVKSRQQS